MDYDVAEVEEPPASLGGALTVVKSRPAAFQRLLQGLRQPVHLAGRLAGEDDEVVGKVAHASHIEQYHIGRQPLRGEVYSDSGVLDGLYENLLRHAAL